MMVLSRVRITVTVVVSRLRLTMYFPSREKPRPWELTERVYCGFRVFVRRVSPRLIVPRTRFWWGEITVSVFDVWSPVIDSVGVRDGWC